MAAYPAPRDHDDFDDAGHFWGLADDEMESARQDPEMYLADGTFIGDMEFVLHPQPRSYWLGGYGGGGYDSGYGD